MPDHAKTRLAPLIRVLSGFAFDSAYFTTADAIPLIRIRDLNNQTTEVQYAGLYKDEYLVKNGDLLIGMDGDFEVVRWKGDKALLNQRICKLETVDPAILHQDYLFYFIIDKIRAIHQQTAATTVKHLSIRDIEQIEFLLPQIDTQTKIAAVLATIDLAIEQTEAVIAKYRRIKTGLMHDLLTHGIDKNNQLRDPLTHKFKSSPLGLIPEEWDLISLRELSTGITSGSRGWAKYYSEEGAKFIRIGNLTREHVNLSLENIQYVKPPVGSEGKRTSLEVGDLLGMCQAC